MEMEDSTTQLLTEIRDNQQLIIRGLRHISKQNDTLLKAGARPKMTIKRMWEDYGKPITSMLSWAPVALVLGQIIRGGKIQEFLGKLAGLF